MNGLDSCYVITEGYLVHNFYVLIDPVKFHRHLNGTRFTSSVNKNSIDAKISTRWMVYLIHIVSGFFGGLFQTYLISDLCLASSPLEFVHSYMSLA